MLRRLKDSGRGIEESPVDAARLAQLIQIVEKSKITSQSGKKLLDRLFELLTVGLGLGADVITLATNMGLMQISDTSAIEQAAREVIEKNPDNVAKFRGGNEGVFKFFVGQVMRATRGQANPQAVNDILRRLLA